MKKIPKNMQGIFWSSPVEKLDIDKNKVYIIHQTLMFGDLNHIRWLFETYPKKQIKKAFIEKPQKIYTKPAVNYISRYVLGLDNPPPFEKYVQTTLKTNDE